VTRAPAHPGAEADAEAFARRHLRLNLTVLAADFGLFLVGLSFASRETILPAFAADLGAPSLVIGAIPAVMTAGWFLPSLFVAGYTQSLAYRMPFVLRYTIWERVPLLVLALAAFFVATRAPGLALTILLLMLFVMTAVGGVLMPAWMDVVGRTIPTELRGRFFAAGSLIGSIGGLGAGIATAYILATVEAPSSYGVCFLASFVFMALSFGALALTREPPAAGTTPPVPIGTYLRRVPALLRHDRNLAWFLVARGCAAFGMMASGFYTVYALRTFAAPAWQVGVFTTVLLLGQSAGNIALGWLADRAGHRVVIIVGVAATVASNLWALTAPSLPTFGAVFALTGVQIAAINISWINVLLEFAPAVDERPTYVGLGNTALAPTAFVAPLVAGALVDTVGFAPTFVAATVFGLAALALLVMRVRDPRHAGR
jgi:MFS family permease